MTKTRTITGYNVYTADNSFCGHRATIEDARELASRSPEGLEESLWDTARKAGHCNGLRAPETTHEAEEPCEWAGDYAIVPVFAHPLTEVREYVTTHSDDDDHDADELERMFAMAYGRQPDDEDRAEGLWSHLVAAVE